MLGYSQYVSKFLNDIENHIPNLVSPTCSTLIKTNVCNDIRSIVLFGNNPSYLDIISIMVIKSRHDRQTITKRKGSFNYVNYCGIACDIEYEYSDYHFELDYSDKHITFIKSIIQNKSIANKPFIFIIKNIDDSNKSAQLPLKQIMDGTGNIQFIFTVKNCSKIEETLLSRSILINASFKIHTLYDVVKNITNSSINFDTFVSMYRNNDCSIVITLLQIEFGNKKPTLYTHLDLLMEKMKKEKSQFLVIQAIREYVYKIYHLTIPLDVICKYIIKKFENHKYIDQIISLAAECDHCCCNGNKNILVYEKFLVGLYKVIST